MFVTVFGSINIDMTTYGQRIPQPGETLHGHSYAIALGGKGCNQAVAASRLGAQTTLVGRIGQDNFGVIALDALRKNGVPTEGVRIVPQTNTGVAVISVDSAGENCITVIGGANMTIDATDIEAARSIFEKTDILLLQMEIPLPMALEAARIVRSTGGWVIMDPAPAPADGFAPEVYPLINVITPNESETEILTGIRPTTPEEAATAASRLRELGVQNAIIKLGANGVYFQSAEDAGFIPPYTVSSIDSVAAGDCFNGGLAFALAQGKSIRDAVSFAAACGALSTTKTGASDSAPKLPDVLALQSTNT